MLKLLVHLSDPDRICEILDYIHDLWFDLEQLDYIKAKRELTIPDLIKVKQRQGSMFSRSSRIYKEKYLLVINHVNDCTIEDAERVGSYDINTIVHEDQKNMLAIKAGIPLRFEMNVSKFELSLFG